jgi:hypothetical protein
MFLAMYTLASAYFMAGSGAVTRQVQASSPFVTLKNGSYAGLYSPEYDQDFFLGMPYAKVGEKTLSVHGVSSLTIKTRERSASPQLSP